MNRVLSLEDLESVKWNPAAAFLLVAERHPGVVALDMDGEKISNRKLAQRVVDFAAHIRGLGIGPGSTVALHLEGGAVWLVMMLACWLAGAKWYRVTRETLDIQSALNPTHFISNRQDGLRMNVQSHVMDRSWGRASGSLLPEGAQSLADDICFLATSSGTTGTPKVIPMTFRNMMRRFLTNSQIKGYDFNRYTVISAFPSGSLARVIASGMVLMRLSGLILSKDPEYIQENVGSVAASLSGIAKWTESFKPGRRKIPLLRLSGSPVGAGSLERLLENWFEQVINIYGASELGHIYLDLYALKDGQVEWTQHVVEGIEIEIVGRDGEGVGDIRVRGDRLVGGYLGEADATAEYFRDSWFYPGDHGFYDSEGRIHIVGRALDIVNLGGVKANLNSIDDAVCTLPEVTDACAFLEDSDQDVQKVSCLVQVQTVSDDLAEVASKVRKAVSRIAPLEALPVRIIFVHAVPRNANGKVVRGRAQEIAAGEPDGGDVRGPH